jgi:hypothetical protein
VGAEGPFACSILFVSAAWGDDCGG